MRPDATCALNTPRSGRSPPHTPLVHPAKNASDRHAELGRGQFNAGVLLRLSPPLRCRVAPLPGVCWLAGISLFREYPSVATALSINNYAAGRSSNDVSVSNRL